MCKGVHAIDTTDHIRYGCHHIRDTYAPRTEICRICFHDGAKRVKAVSVGAYAISKDVVCAQPGEPGIYCYGVVYQTSMEEKIEKEKFIGYCKEEINTVLSLLSCHSADIDPRVICLNPDLYWSIIWYYGSVYTALESIGGKELQQKVFGKHKKQMENTGRESPDPFLSLLLESNPFLKVLDNQKRYNSAFEPSDCPGKAELDKHNYKELGNRPETHFMGTLLNNAGEWRFVCGNEDCLKFEETSKFMKCAGCKDSVGSREFQKNQ